MQYDKKNTKKHTQNTNTNTHESRHSERGPVRQNPIQRTVRTAHLSVLMTVQNFSTQYSTEQFWYLPSYLQNTTNHSLDVVYRRRRETLEGTVPWRENDIKGRIKDSWFMTSTSGRGMNTYNWRRRQRIEIYFQCINICAQWDFFYALVMRLVYARTYSQPTGNIAPVLKLVTIRSQYWTYANPQNFAQSSGPFIPRDTFIDIIVIAIISLVQSIRPHPTPTQTIRPPGSAER